MDAISRSDNRSRYTSEESTCAPPPDPEQARKEADRAAEQRRNDLYSAPQTDARGASRSVPLANKTDDWSAAKKDSERTRKLDKPLEEDVVGNALLGLPGQIVAKGVQWLGIHLAKELIKKAFVDTFKPTPEFPDAPKQP
jgi:hypothetical protein